LDYSRAVKQAVVQAPHLQVVLLLGGEVLGAE